jgi:hypothetical protein
MRERWIGPYHRFLESAFGSDGRVWFTLIGLLYIAESYVTRNLIITRELYYKTFAEQLAAPRIEKLFSLSMKYAWVGYLSIFLIVGVKSLFSSVCLNVGSLLLGSQVQFRQLFRISVIAEIPRCLAAIWKTLHFIFVSKPNSLSDIAWYQPLSLSWLFESYKGQSWFVYPAQFLNAFELLYIFLLSLGFSVLSKSKYSRALAVTVCTYGLGILTWVSFVVFLSLSAG